MATAQMNWGINGATEPLMELVFSEQRVCGPRVPSSDWPAQEGSWRPEAPSLLGTLERPHCVRVGR